MGCWNISLPNTSKLKYCEILFAHKLLIVKSLWNLSWSVQYIKTSWQLNCPLSTNENPRDLSLRWVLEEYGALMYCNSQPRAYSQPSSGHFTCIYLACVSLGLTHIISDKVHVNYSSSFGEPGNYSTVEKDGIVANVLVYTRQERKSYTA